MKQQLSTTQHSVANRTSQPSAANKTQSGSFNDTLKVKGPFGTEIEAQGNPANDMVGAGKFFVGCMGVAVVLLAAKWVMKEYKEKKNAA